MAVAGFHNISAFDRSFFGDPRPSTRTSPLFQMWRELENEHITNHQSYKSRQPIGNDSDSENGDDIMSQHSYESKNQLDDLAEIERERVRRIFREWMNSGSTGRSSYGFCSKNGFGRRPMRRLCGRQALLDLLASAQSERKRELSDLAGRRPVSEFAHRNRIQALLKVRFLRNERSIADVRPSSRGETELSLLRLRHTVSDLREGFLSKSDNSASTSVISVDSNNSSSDMESSADDGDPVLYNEMRDRDVSRAPDSENFTMASDEPSLESEDVNFNDDDRANDEFDSVDASARVEDFRDSVVEIEHCVWQHHDIVVFSQTSDDTREGFTYQSFPEQFDDIIEEHAFDNDNVVEQDPIQESHRGWSGHDSQEAVGSWLDMPSRSMELRELFTRRHVSSLLRSSFRERLNQVLQSHAERLGRASDISELEDASSFRALIQQDQEQTNDDQTFSLIDGDFERNPFAPSSNLVASSQSLRTENFWGTNWSHHDSSMHFEMEWEAINELRIDMARLHHRMNDMQSMIEACMEMQLELQRSVRQEVSDASNRSVFSTDEEDSIVDNGLRDESLCDYVRKGICCICRDSKIESLLYRCGHICVCCQCADSLVRSKGKCPMCRAPAVESVQAYFIE